MSSKIVRGPGGVESVSWRRAAESGPAETGRATLPDRAGEELAAALSLVQRLRAELADSEARAAESVAGARQAAWAEGRSAGYQEGYSVAQTEGKALVAGVQAEAAGRAAQSAAQAVELRRRLRQQMEADLVRLAIAVARRILRRELSVDPAALLGIVKSAVERMAARELLAIRVAPGDAPRLSSQLASLQVPDRVEVVADTALPWGSVVFETTRGQIDASIETQIQEIDRGLADMVHQDENRAV